MKGVSIEDRARGLAQYIIDTGDTVRGAAKKFGVSKSTVHMDVKLQNGKNKGHPIPESIGIKGAFLSTKNSVVKLGLLIKWNKKIRWFALNYVDYFIFMKIYDKMYSSEVDELNNFILNHLENYNKYMKDYDNDEFFKVGQYECIFEEDDIIPRLDKIIKNLYKNEVENEYRKHINRRCWKW